MSTLHVDSAMAAALWIAVKASMVLGAAALVQVVLRRRASAAARHLIWTLATLGVLGLPALSLLAPRWDVTIPAPAPAGGSAPAVVGRVADAPPAAGASAV